MRQGLPAAEAEGRPGTVLLLIFHVQDIEQPVRPFFAEGHAAAGPVILPGHGQAQVGNAQHLFLESGV